MGLAHTVITARVVGAVTRPMRVVVTDGGPFQPLIDYFAEKQARSLGWQHTFAQATGMLIDWMFSKGGHYEDLCRRDRLLADFAWAVRRGTLDDDGGSDPSGLYWEGTSPKRTNEIVKAICAFSDWLVDRYGAVALDPGRRATWGEQMAYWRRWNTRSATDLLRHTGPSRKAEEVSKRKRRVDLFHEAKKQPGLNAVKRFPEDRIIDLLFRGFVRKGAKSHWPLHLRYNLRDILITILLHGGGLRESEPFHLFTTDVCPDPIDPNVALVRVYDPVEGTIQWDDPVTGTKLTGTRKKFLQDVYRRQPRNLVIGERRSGWKDPAYTDAENGKYIQVFWFPSFWGRLFLVVYNIYMLKVYPTERLDHPFLFVSLNDRHCGRPYTLHSFLANHRAAVRRIGLPVLKRYGTTPHGHRHAMGARMDAAGLPGKIQSLALHHASPFSRLVYNERTVTEVRQELAKAEGRDGGGADPLVASARLEKDIDTWIEAANPALRLARSR